MPVTARQPASHLLILFFSILSFLFLIMNIIYRPLPDTIVGMPVHAFLSGLLVTLFFLGLGYYLKKSTTAFQFNTIAETLGYLVVFGLLTLAVAGAPYILALFDYKWKEIDELLVGYQASSLLLLTSFYFLCLFLLKRLIFMKPQKWMKKSWAVFIGALIAANIFNFYIIRIPDLILIIAFAVGAATSFPLIGKVNWIGFLKGKEKYQVPGLAALLLIMSVLNGYIFFDLETADLFHISLSRNIAFALPVFFSIIYLLFALLSLLFSIPLAHIFADKDEEIQSFKALAQLADKANNREEILKLLFNNSLKNAQANAGWITFSKHETFEELILNSENIDQKDLKRILFTVSYNKKHYLIRNDKEYRYIKDFKKDENLQNHLLPFQSMLIFSVHINGEFDAKIYLLKEDAYGFDHYAADTVLGYISQAKLALRDVSRINETIETERYKKDVEIGRHLQRSLLPQKFPDNKVLELSAVSIAAEEVGGDYYDFFQLSDHEVAVIMADASGKGTSAAFHVAEMKGIFQSLILSGTRPGDFVKKANIAISRCYEKGMFITMIYMIIDLRKKTIKYSRAGHCPILHYSSEGRFIHYLEDEGLGLGIVRNEKYDEMVSEHEFAFNKGDVIMLYTDGVVEARSEHLNEEWGFERLKKIVRASHTLDSNDIMNEVVREVTEFTHYDMSRDDISMLIFKAK